MQELKISPKAVELLQDYVLKLQDVFQDNLLSVILYGSAARGEFMHRHSNLNVLIVLADTGLEKFKSAAKSINRFRFRTIDPLILSEHYIKSSCDVFPIEFLDMKESYAVLAGRDVLKDVTIDTKNLRFQCEQELKAKLITLRQAYLRLSRNKGALKYLLFRYLTSIVHIARNMLRLKGKNIPYKKSDIVIAVAQEFGVSTLAFKKVLAVKNKEIKLYASEIEPLFFEFTAELEKIVDIVDKL